MLRALEDKKARYRGGTVREAAVGHTLVFGGSW